MESIEQPQITDEHLELIMLSPRLFPIVVKQLGNTVPEMVVIRDELNERLRQIRMLEILQRGANTTVDESSFVM